MWYVLCCPHAWVSLLARAVRFLWGKLPADVRARLSFGTQWCAARFAYGSNLLAVAALAATWGGSAVNDYAAQFFPMHPSFPKKADATSAAFHDNLVCLAENIYFEARGESRKGQRFVAHVALNRWENPRFALRTPCDVVYFRARSGLTGNIECAFSWVCEGSAEITDAKAYRASLAIARELLTATLEGVRIDETGGADHFYSHCLLQKPPYWAAAMTGQQKVGCHTFLKSPRQRAFERDRKIEHPLVALANMFKWIWLSRRLSLFFCGCTFSYVKAKAGPFQDRLHSFSL